MPSGLIRKMGMMTFTDAQTKAVGAERRHLLNNKAKVFSDAGNRAYCTILTDLIKTEMIKTNQIRPAEGSLFNHCHELSLEHKADVIEALLTNLRASKNPMVKRMLQAVENLCTEDVELQLKDHNRARPLYVVFEAWKRSTWYVPLDLHIPTAIEIE